MVDRYLSQTFGVNPDNGRTTDNGRTDDGRPHHDSNSAVQ